MAHDDVYPAIPFGIDRAGIGNAALSLSTYWPQLQFVKVP